MRHGQENYTIEGEGPQMFALRRGAGRESFHFSRLGPLGTTPDEQLLRALGRAMTAGSSIDAVDVPAGYTYLGQFVDHDLTLDLTPEGVAGDDVGERIQGRSPTLDLDCVYGRGPRDRHDDRLYADDRASLHVGLTQAIAGPPPVGDAGTNRNLFGYDLPRVGRGPRKSQRQKAAIPDLRNDENLVVAQTHLAFMRFHNAVVAQLTEAGTPSSRLFEKARSQVVKHYQWIVRHDFLPRIVDPTVLDDVFQCGRRFIEPDRHDRVATMPVEFSVAAYRLGHSMIRATYEWNRVFHTGAIPASLGLLFTFSGTSGTLNAGTDVNDQDAGLFERLPSNWAVDWRRFYDFAGAGRPELAAPQGAGNLAMRIDTALEDPLATLPLGSFGGHAVTDPDELNLAFRNLRRAASMRLASGQQMAVLFGEEPLRRDEIVHGGPGSALDMGGLPRWQRRELTSNTPLWFYILREAELHGGSLHGVGARIVAETFHRAMEASRYSIVRDRRWKPSVGRTAGEFSMVDLLVTAFGDDVDALNPLGDVAPGDMAAVEDQVA